MSCALLDCLKRRFCAEFQAGTCNINYIKPPYLEKPGKDVQVSFSHGAYFADSKKVARQKMKAKGEVSRKCSVFLKCSKMQKIDRCRCVLKYKNRMPQNAFATSRLDLFFEFVCNPLKHFANWKVVWASRFAGTTVDACAGFYWCCIIT